jgi:hypothetical protein
MQMMLKGTIYKGFCWLNKLNLGSYNRVPTLANKENIKLLKRSATSLKTREGIMGFSHGPLNAGLFPLTMKCD